MAGPVSALHGPQRAGALLRIGNVADRRSTAEQLFEIRLRKLTGRDGPRVFCTASNDSENNHEIAPMGSLNPRGLGDLACQVRRLFGLPSERSRKRKIGCNVEIVRLRGQRLFERRLSFGELSRHGLRDAEAVVGRTGIDVWRGLGEGGETLLKRALLRERRTEAEQRIGVVRILCEGGAIRCNRAVKLLGTQICITEPHMRSRRIFRRGDGLTIELEGSVAAAVRFDVACEAEEVLRSVRAGVLSICEERGFVKTCASGETCQQHEHNGFRSHPGPPATKPSATRVHRSVLR